MRRFTFAEIIVASLVLAAAMSAATCIIPGELSRAFAEWHEKRTPEAEEALRQASGWPLREHAILAVQLFIPFALALGCFNRVLPARPS